MSVAILNYFLVFVMQFRTSTPYAVVEFMSYIDQHHQGAASEHVTEELPEISDQGGDVGGATHTPDVPESSHMQENVHVGADAGSQSPPHAGTGGTNGSAEHVHERIHLTRRVVTTCAALWRSGSMHSQQSRS